MSTGQFGPYRLDELLGRGGMGDVYRAFDTRRERFVALKLLKAEMVANPDFEARFRRESKLAAQLHEPHIIPIHDFGEIDGRLYLDMRLVEGSDLAALLRKGPLAPHRAVDLIGQVASALDAAHAAGLVHRDVKPSNIMISGNGTFAYLADFGIVSTMADPTDPRLTATGAVLGTSAYMAPERFDGLGDHRGDVYALGCVLFEALTGKRPYQGDNLLATMAMHMTKPPPRPSEYGLPPALDAVLATALATDPARRYQNAGGLADAAAAALTAPTTVPDRPTEFVAPARPTAPAAPASGQAAPWAPGQSGPLPGRPMPGRPMPAGPTPAGPPAAPVPAAGQGWSGPSPVDDLPRPPTHPLPADGRSRSRLVVGTSVLVVVAAVAIVVFVLGNGTRAVPGDGTPVAQAPSNGPTSVPSTRAGTPSTTPVATPLEPPPAVANPPRTRAELERYLAAQPSYRSTAGPPVAVCPGDLPTAVDATLVCSVKTPSTEYRVTLTVDEPAAGGVGFHLNNATE